MLQRIISAGRTTDVGLLVKVVGSIESQDDWANAGVIVMKCALNGRNGCLEA
jgi:hypothetical protein